jgi:hypothetical protein
VWCKRAKERPELSAEDAIMWHLKDQPDRAAKSLPGEFYRDLDATIPGYGTAALSGAVSRLFAAQKIAKIKAGKNTHYLTGVCLREKKYVQAALADIAKKLNVEYDRDIDVEAFL